ncbi:MAG: hypothetical protein LBC99_10555 [Spirochaetota bacterium]|jgi:hypothetical protein|nr:hypothetical protein [Spirochaetota bacterium]
MLVFDQTEFETINRSNTDVFTQLSLSDSESWDGTYLKISGSTGTVANNAHRSMNIGGIFGNNSGGASADYRGTGLRMKPNGEYTHITFWWKVLAYKAIGAAGANGAMYIGIDRMSAATVPGVPSAQNPERIPSVKINNFAKTSYLAGDWVTSGTAWDYGAGAFITINGRQELANIGWTYVTLQLPPLIITSGTQDMQITIRLSSAGSNTSPISITWEVCFDDFRYESL